MVYIGALKGSMDSAIPELTTQLRDKSEYALSNPQEIRRGPNCMFDSMSWT